MGYRKLTGPKVDLQSVQGKKPTKPGSKNLKNKKNSTTTPHVENQYLFNTHHISAVLGIARSTVNSWPIAPDIPAHGSSPAQYDIRKFIKYIFDEKNSEDIDERREKAKQARYNAEMSRLDLEVRQGKLLPVEQVQDALDDIMVTFRTAVLNLPAKLALQLSNRTPEEIQKALKNETDEILQSIVDKIGASADSSA